MIRQAGILLLAVVLLTGITLPASAQLADNLSSFDESTVQGYLKPLQETVGQALNTAFFTTAAIPERGFHARLDLKLMSVFVKDSDRTFQAVTGGDFSPQQRTETSTIFGPGNSATVTGDANTQYTFPGGVDLGSLSLVVPQITIGAFKGTEAYVRWLAAGTNEPELGTVTTWGIGGRHSISQYLGGPIDLAGAIFYQKLSAETDLLDVSTFSIGAQASTDLLPFLRALGALSYDSVSMSTTYVKKTGAVDEPVTVDLDTAGSLHVSLGAFIGVGPVGLSITGDLASHAGISFNLGAGF